MSVDRGLYRTQLASLQSVPTYRGTLLRIKASNKHIEHASIRLLPEPLRRRSQPRDCVTGDARVMLTVERRSLPAQTFPQQSLKPEYYLGVPASGNEVSERREVQQRELSSEPWHLRRKGSKTSESDTVLKVI